MSRLQYVIGSKIIFKFQYDNTLSHDGVVYFLDKSTFKFQYDNTLSVTSSGIVYVTSRFKFQYDNTLSCHIFSTIISNTNLNSNMIIL